MLCHTLHSSLGQSQGNALDPEGIGAGCHTQSGHIAPHYGIDSGHIDDLEHHNAH